MEPKVKPEVAEKAQWRNEQDVSHWTKKRRDKRNESDRNNSELHKRKTRKAILYHQFTLSLVPIVTFAPQKLKVIVVCLA